MNLEGSGVGERGGEGGKVERAPPPPFTPHPRVKKKTRVDADALWSGWQRVGGGGVEWKRGGEVGEKRGK